MFWRFPHIALPGHQGAKARVTQQNARLFCQVQPQPVERPDREWQPKRVRVEVKHPRQFVTVGDIGFRRASTALSVSQPRYPVLTPAFVPGVDRVARHHDGLCHLFGRLSQMQQADGDGALAHLGFRCMVDRFFQHP